MTTGSRFGPRHGVLLMRAVELLADRIRRDGSALPSQLADLAALGRSWQESSAAITSSQSVPSGMRGGDDPPVSAVSSLPDRREVARRLGVSVPTVDRLVASGQLRSVRVGARLVRFRPEDITAYLECNGAHHDARTG